MSHYKKLIRPNSINIDNIKKDLSGLSYTIFDKGSTSCTTNVDKIKQNLDMIFATIPGQRFFEPWYGFTGYEYLFEPNDFIFEDLMKYHIEKSIKACEPRVRVDSITPQPLPDSKAYYFNINLTIIELGTELEYPYYVKRGGSEE